MSLLSSISGPRDLDALGPEQLEQLAGEIRAFLIENVSRTGGHLGPNLGVVELTIAMHKVFDSPNDPIVFDTGHQSYVHKLLTGRQDFTGLRSRGGLAGYPQRSESPHDVVESSHASSSLSWADGISRALDPDGPQRPACHRRRRRRCAHRWDDLGGAQQHLRRQRPQPRHHRQRQRQVVRADDRRDGALSEPGAHGRQLSHAPPQLRLVLRQARACVARLLPRRPRRNARLPVPVHQQRRAVLQPRHQVPGPDRRPRPPNGHRDTRAGEGLRRSRDRPRDHRQGPRLPARPRRRGRSVPRRGPHRSGIR